MKRMPKTSQYVGVRLTEENFNKLMEAGRVAWPGAQMSKASTILSLALREAERVLAEKHKPKKQ